MHDADSSTQHKRRRSARVLAVAAALVGVALLVAACGGGGNNPGVANVATSTTSTDTHSSSTGASNSGGDLGGGAPPVANPNPVGHSEVAMIGGNRTQELKLSVCMRAHGEPNFPDPNAQGELQFGSAQGIDPGSAQFKAASQQCRRYLPHRGQAPSPAQQAQFEQQALNFSKCMRSHGISNFPDPQFGPGGSTSIRIGGKPGSGLDPRSPTFQAAQKACASNLPGKFGAGPSTIAGGKR